MPVAVVGGSGFIGTRLCRALESDGRAFRIIDKQMSHAFPEQTVLADVRDVGKLTGALEGCDTIVNLAAEHHDDVRPISLYDDVNVGGARNVCRAAEKLEIQRIVFTSSVAIYGFALRNTGEDGSVNPFNDYGRTKAEAEVVYRAWQEGAPGKRMLSLVRPTVVFGERNRGNVYNLLRQIASGRFVMVGDGKNCKSMAYVGNVVAFLRCMMGRPPGVHVCNYIDKPDMDMNALIGLVRVSLHKGRGGVGIRLPYAAGYAVGAGFDLLAWATGRHFPVSRIRVKKFCATTQFSSAKESFGFRPPFTLTEALRRTLEFEFAADAPAGPLFYSE